MLNVDPYLELILEDNIIVNQMFTGPGSALINHELKGTVNLSSNIFIDIGYITAPTAERESLPLEHPADREFNFTS